MVFSNTFCSKTPWPFGEILNKFTPLLTDFTLFLGFDIFGGAPNSSKDMLVFSVQNLLRVSFSYWSYPLFCLGLFYTSDCDALVAFLVGACFFPSEWGSFEALVPGLICFCEAMFWGVLLLSLLYCRILTIKVSLGGIILYQTVFIVFSLFLV